jgi:hypothetical protein
MVHDSGVSREKRSERGHGSEDVGGCARMSGAFCESARAVGGGMCVGGERRFACDMVLFVCEGAGMGRCSIAV